MERRSGRSGRSERSEPEISEGPGSHEARGAAERAERPERPERAEHGDGPESHRSEQSSRPVWRCRKAELQSGRSGAAECRSPHIAQAVSGAGPTLTRTRARVQRQSQRPVSGVVSSRLERRLLCTYGLKRVDVAAHTGPRAWACCPAQKRVQAFTQDTALQPVVVTELSVAACSRAIAKLDSSSSKKQSNSDTRVHPWPYHRYYQTPIAKAGCKQWCYVYSRPLLQDAPPGS